MQWMAPWTKRQRRNSPSPSPKTSPSCGGGDGDLSFPEKIVTLSNKKKKNRMLFGKKRRRRKPIEAKPTPEDAPWRIENILVNGPPSETEWWEDVSLPDSTPSSAVEDGHTKETENAATATCTTASSFVNTTSATSCATTNVDKGGPIGETTITAAGTPEQTNKDENKQKTTEAKNTTKDDQGQGTTMVTKKFHNHGFEAWTRAREAWRIQTVEERPPTLPPVVNKHQIIRGLNNLNRSYELPNRMALNDLISIYVQIWEGDED